MLCLFRGVAMIKNITLSAEEILLEQGRRRARDEQRSLNVAFREWLARYVSQDQAQDRYCSLMESLHYADAGRHLSRDELNER